MGDPCPGGCNRTWRKAWADYHQAHERYLTHLEEYQQGRAAEEPSPPEKPGLTPVPGEPVWCPRCAGSIRTGLADLEDLAAVLQAQIDGHRPAPTDEPVTGGGGQGSPDGRVDLLDELLWWLRGVEDDWRAVCGFAGRPRRGRFAPSLAQGLHWLGLHASDWLAREVWRDGVTGMPLPAGGAEQVGRRVWSWRSRLAAAARATPEARRKAGRCPRCDRRTLTQDTDSGYIRCESEDCGRLLKASEYDELADAQAQGQERGVMSTLSSYPPEWPQP